LKGLSETACQAHKFASTIEISHLKKDGRQITAHEMVVEMSVDKVSREATWTALSNPFGYAGVHARKCWEYKFEMRKRFYFGQNYKIHVGSWNRGEKMIFHAYSRNEYCDEEHHYTHFIMHVKRPGHDWAFIGSERWKVVKTMAGLAKGFKTILRTIAGNAHRLARGIIWGAWWRKRSCKTWTPVKKLHSVLPLVPRSQNLYAWPFYIKKR